jgi:hypothetical protein
MSKKAVKTAVLSVPPKTGEKAGVLFKLIS